MEKIKEILIRIFLQEHGDIEREIEKLRHKQYRFKRLLLELGYDLDD
jgi:hypothetical protein